MKKLLTTFAIIFLFIYAQAQVGSFENIVVEQRDDGSGFVDIHFDLTGAPGYMYDISIEVSLDGGDSFSLLPFDYLSGDLEELVPAEGYHIEWDGLASHPDVETEEAQLKMIATLVAEDDWLCGMEVTFVYQGEEVTYGTLERGGLCWLDRNLGASQVPTANNDPLGYGDLFQFGRLDDGHQDRNSETTVILSESDVPGHSDFIIIIEEPFDPYDWRSPQNDDLWQGVNGINNPCPEGWRLPTQDELEDERESWHSNTSMGAWGSTLKWPATGGRHYDGGLIWEGMMGSTWTSTITGTQAYGLNYLPNNAFVGNGVRALGSTVRCVRDI